MSVIRTHLLALVVVVATPTAFADDKVDVENGKTIFDQRCGICHAATKEDSKIMGPNMVGLVGRKAGSEPSFPTYSNALKDYKVTWSTKTLDEFLANPMVKVPGTTMPMFLPDDKERADVIAYLGTLTPKK